MSRVRAGFTRRARHKKILKLAKGFRGRSNSCFRIAVERVEKALQYSYRDRRNKKRNFRGLWIQRINAAARSHGMVYSQFMRGVKMAQIDLNRKMLSEIAIHDAQAFEQIVDASKKALESN